MISNCCGASLLENSDICADCKEHCEPEDGDASWVDPGLVIAGVDFNESIRQLDGLIKKAHKLKEKYAN